MKKTALFITAILCFASCAKEQYSITESNETNGSTEQNVRELIISAGTQTKVSFGDSPSVLKWQSSDKLVIFDENLTYGASTGNAKGKTDVDDDGNATFKFATWSGNDPIFAIASRKASVFTGDNFTKDSDNYYATVPFSDKQNILSSNNIGGAAFVSVGSIEKKEGNYTVNQMKNTVGLIKFDIATYDVDSIVVEAPGNEPLSGMIKINCTELAKENPDTWWQSVEKQVSNKVQITLAKENYWKDRSFCPGSYYLMVLPQNYTQGLTFTLYKRTFDDKGQTTASTVVATKTIGKNVGFTVNRSQIIEITSPMIVKEPYETLPEKFDLTMDFESVKPFGSSLTPAANQDSKLGEKYTYNPKTATVNNDFEFILCKGTTASASYSQGTSNLTFSKAAGWILIPAVKGKYLNKIAIKTGNSVAKPFGLKSADGLTTISTGLNAYNTDTYLDFDITKIKKETPYRLVIEAGGTNIKTLVLQYADKRSVEGKLPEADEYTVTLDFSTSNPFPDFPTTKDARSATGSSDKVTFNYKLEKDDIQYSKDLEFYICKDSNISTEYSYGSGVLNLPCKEGFKLPAFEDKFLKSVTLHYTNNAAASGMIIKNSFGYKASTNADYLKGYSSSASPANVSFTTSDTKVAKNSAYYLRHATTAGGTTTKLNVSKLVLVYSKTLPTE